MVLMYKAKHKAKLGYCGCQSGTSPKLDIVEGSHESEGRMGSFCNIQLWRAA